MLLLALLIACTGTSQPVTPTVTPSVGPSALAPAAPERRPAPSREIYGLTIGGSKAEDIDAWLAARSLACPGVPSVRRTSTRYECNAPLAATLLPDRKIAGALTQVLLVRGDATPLRHFSSERRYSLPADAVTDFTTAVAAITERLGAPTSPAPMLDAAKLEVKIARYAASWAFSDLEVKVVALRVNPTFITVGETWSQPGATVDDETRAMPTGVDPHAGMHGAPPPGTPGAPDGAGAPATHP